jgi:hypothetical protein
MGDRGHVAAELVELRGVRRVDDHGMISWTALDREQAMQRVRICRIGTEAVHGLRRERDEAAGAENFDRALDHQ